MGKNKSGPPYTNPYAEYVVVNKPCFLNPSSRSRTEHEFSKLASWVKLVLEDAGQGDVAPEQVFGMGTRDEVIVQLPLGTDVRPLLGEHLHARWSARPLPPSSANASTCVFAYNYRDHGDPDKHNWTPYTPTIFPLATAPIVRPYPPPGWTQVPHVLRKLVLPIPRPEPPPPLTATSSTTPSSSTLRFESSPATDEGYPGIVDRLAGSPFTPDEEYNALERKSFKDEPDVEILKTISELGEVDVKKPVRIKGEADYRPSEALLRAYESLSSSTRDVKPKTKIKSEPETKQGYRPSAALRSAVAEYLSQHPEEVNANVDVKPRLKPEPQSEHDYRPSAALRSAVEEYLSQAAAATADADVKPKLEPGINSAYRPSAELRSAVESYLQRLPEDVDTDEDVKPVVRVKTEFEYRRTPTNVVRGLDDVSADRNDVDIKPRIKRRLSEEEPESAYRTRKKIKSEL